MNKFLLTKRQMRLLDAYDDTLLRMSIINSQWEKYSKNLRKMNLLYKKIYKRNMKMSKVLYNELGDNWHALGAISHSYSYFIHYG